MTKFFTRHDILGKRGVAHLVAHLVAHYNAWKAQQNRRMCATAPLFSLIIYRKIYKRVIKIYISFCGFSWRCGALIRRLLTNPGVLLRHGSIFSRFSWRTRGALWRSRGALLSLCKYFRLAN